MGSQCLMLPSHEDERKVVLPTKFQSTDEASAWCSCLLREGKRMEREYSVGGYEKKRKEVGASLAFPLRTLRR